jgi:hypothetical protein
MGSPNHSGDTAFWEEVLAKLANMPHLKSFQTNLLKELEPKSALLGKICSQFVHRARALNIFSFYEQVKTASLDDLVRTKAFG